MPTDIFAGDTLSEEFGRLNPARMTPVLELDSDELIVQPNAILWYLAEGARVAHGRGGLDALEAHLADRQFVVGDAPSIADLSLFAYTHVAPDAGIELDPWPAVRGWIERIEALPGFVDDYVPYPDNARPGRSRSIYD